MILSGNAIERAGIITPFSERTVFNGMSYGRSLAGYDIRIVQNVLLGRDRTFTIASSMERFNIPNDVVGVVHDKSSWARKGLSVFNTVCEPGWEGYLTLELVYHGDGLLRIDSGSPIAQVVFHLILEVTEGYNGKYQNQPNRPVEAIEEISRY